MLDKARALAAEYEELQKRLQDPAIHMDREKLKEFGLVVFNRHYYQNHIFEASIFLDKLKKIFNDVDSKKILTNLIIFCRK